MYDCPVIHPEEPTVSTPPETPSAPSPGTHSNTEDIVANTPETYPPWPHHPLGFARAAAGVRDEERVVARAGKTRREFWAATSALASVMAAQRARSLARVDHGRGAWKGTSAGAARRSFAARSIGTPPWRTGAS